MSETSLYQHLYVNFVEELRELSCIHFIDMRTTHRVDKTLTGKECYTSDYVPSEKISFHCQINDQELDIYGDYFYDQFDKSCQIVFTCTQFDKLYTSEKFDFDENKKIKLFDFRKAQKLFDDAKTQVLNELEDICNKKLYKEYLKRKLLKQD